MKHEKKIGYGQVVALITEGVLGISIITLPTKVITAAGNGAWLSVLISGVIATLFALMAARLALYYKEETMVEYLPKIYGSALGSILNLLLIMYLIFVVALNSRYFADIAKLYLLPNTPRWAILLPLWLVAAYWTHHGIRVITLTLSIPFILTLIAMVFLFLLPINQVKLEHYMPLLGDGFPSILKGVSQSIFLFFGFASISFIVPVIRDTNKVYKAVTVGMLLTLSIFILSIFTLIGRFSVAEVTNMVNPVIDLIRSFYLPEAFIERTELLFFPIFIFVSLNSIVLYLYLAVLSITKWTRRVNYRLYIIIFILLAYFISMVPKNIVEINLMLDIITYFALFFTVLVIPLGLIVSAIRRRGQRV